MYNQYQGLLHFKTCCKEESLFSKNSKKNCLKAINFCQGVRNEIFNFKMVKPLLLQLGVVIFASIASSRCSILSRSLECPLQGAAFGGRLVLVDGGGLGSGLLPPLADSGRMIIFQTPPAHLRSHMGSGRGQIWIGSRTSSCQSSDSQPDHCPWTEDRPCLDTGIPCETEPPFFVQPNPLEFSEVTEDSITVSWPAWDETTDPGVGPITGYKILHRQQDGIFEEILLDGDRLSHRFDGLSEGTIYQFRVVLVRDGEPPEGPPSKIQNVSTHCRELGHVDLEVETKALASARFIVSWQLPSLRKNCNLTHQQITYHQLDIDNCDFSPQTESREPSVLGTGKRTKSFKRLSPNSLFNITYLATNPAGTYVTSQVHRTAEAEPSGAPSGLQHVPKSNRVQFSWDKPPCGERNGEIIRYEYISSGDPKSGEKYPPAPPRFTIRQLSSGDKWRFKVRACSEAGCGPYAEDSGTMD